MSIKVNVDEVRRVQAYLREINQHDVQDVEWVDDHGNAVPVSEEIIQNYAITGLNTADLVRYYLDVDGEDE